MSTAPICRTCGSPRVSADASVTWDQRGGVWRVSAIFADHAWCDACEDDTVLDNPPPIRSAATTRQEEIA